jgi:hypothetical protein
MVAPSRDSRLEPGTHAHEGGAKTCRCVRDHSLIPLFDGKATRLRLQHGRQGPSWQLSEPTHRPKGHATQGCVRLCPPILVTRVRYGKAVFSRNGSRVS